jgi:hypothetical protein
MIISRSRTFAVASFVLSASWFTGLHGQPAAPADACPPIWKDSTRFAVIGDSGTGGREQHAIGQRMAAAHQVFPFTFVLMMGDNLYGSERPQDYVRKFQQPYKALLDQDVKFYASLGNHDDRNQVYYQLFNMNGERYYTFTKDDVRFFALDSNYMDTRQQEWIGRELSRSNEPWKIAFFHHPLYSSGAKHGAEEDLRNHLEPLFVEHGVDAVFAGHEHFYERLKPQKGIYYFTSGAAAKLRRGNLRRTEQSARGLDTDYSFMLIEVGKEALSFQTLTAKGTRFDAGLVPRREVSAVTDAAGLLAPLDVGTCPTAQMADAAAATGERGVRH